MMLIAFAVWLANAAPPERTLEERAVERVAPSLVLIGTRDEKTGVVSAVGSAAVVAPGVVTTVRALLPPTAALVVVDRDGTLWPAALAPEDKGRDKESAAALALLDVPGLALPPLTFDSTPSGAAVAIVGAIILAAPQSALGRALPKPPLRVATRLPVAGLGGVVVDERLAVVGVVSGLAVDAGEPVVVTVDGRSAQSLVARLKGRPPPSIPQKPPAPRAANAGPPTPAVGVPLFVPPSTPENERLQKLSNAALAEAMSAPPAKTEELLHSAVAWYPWSAAPWVRLARGFDEGGRFADAGGAYEAAAALRKEHRDDACALAALSLQKRALYSSAELVARRCLVDAPQHALSVAVAASARAGRGDFAGATPELRHALALDPSLGWIHGVLGAGLAAAGKLDDAIAEYKKAVAGNTDNAGLYLALGETYVQKGSVDDAIRVYRSAKIEDPTLLARLAELLVLTGRKAEAQKPLARALALDPTNARALALRDTLK